MHRPLAILLLLAVAACGNDDGESDVPAERDARSGTVPELPAPEGAIGSVTGMPAQPGPGTSPIAAVPAAEPTTDTWTDSDYAGVEYAGVEVVDGTGTTLVQPAIPEEPLADAPPIIIVPEVPRDPLADVVAPEPTPPPPEREPIGTEGATESTTFTTEPDDTGD